MRRFTRILTPVLALTVGLWACQDQVVTPDVDVEASFAKPVKPPKPPRIQGADAGLMPAQRRFS